MEIYNIYHKSPSDNAQKFCNRFQALMNVNKYKPCILGDLESSYSSVFYHALDKFLFPTKENGCILHQPVLCKDKHGHSNKPDGYIVKYTNDIPSIPILVSGFKKNAQDYKKAITESVGYFQSIATVSGLHEPPLVMPCTPTKVSLFLCSPINAIKHATIKICETDDQFAKFFSAVKFTVELLGNLKGTGAFLVEPIQGIVLTEGLKPPNVYKKGDMVYKLFDTENNCTVPNVQLVKNVLGDNYLIGMEANSLTLDERFQILTYKYISAEPKHQLTLNDFKPIARALDQLHSYQYVHSDVRLANNSVCCQWRC